MTNTASKKLKNLSDSPFKYEAEFDEDQALRLILEATAAAIGDEFFRALVKNLAQAVGVRYAFIAMFADVKTKIETIAFWDGEKIADNVIYDLQGAPCAEVVQGQLVHCPEGVCEKYPDDPILFVLKAESYLGVPLVDVQGNHLGHMSLMDVEPMSPEPKKMNILKIFAARARVEFERLREESARRANEERLAGILASAMDVIITIDADRRITLFNKAAEETFRCHAGDRIGNLIDDLLTSPLLSVVKGYLQQWQNGTQPSPILISSAENLQAVRADASEFPIEATISRVCVGGADLFTVILRNIEVIREARSKLNRLTLENKYLNDEINHHYYSAKPIGDSKALESALQKARRVASSDTTVLITGETGTGKELLARMIHDQSTRRKKTLIKINCAAIPSTLVESELFGHEKGAFTGALARKIGRFELAEESTIFLDEIGDVPLDIQVKLLRILQEKEFERIGGTDTIRINVRVIAATNRDLLEAIDAGTFREDLYYRLNVFPIKLPPLRERGEDIRLLTDYFVKKYARKIGRNISDISESSMTRLISHTWPGNIRELENIIERAMIMSPGPMLEVGADILPDVKSTRNHNSRSVTMTMDENQKSHILRVLKETNGLIDGPQGAAKVLDMHPNTLRSRIRKLDIKI